jgi:HAD superfamily hydrolase (TIGR01549 family)
MVNPPHKSKQYISFDLDGTLVDLTFTDLVWHQGIPELYAQKAGIDLHEAREQVLQEYRRVGDGALEWYDIAYWFKWLELPGRWEVLLERYASAVSVHAEVHDVLRRLKEDYSLIVLSNGAREFIEVEMREGGLAGYFDLVVSATSDFGLVKKSPELYQRICKILGVCPQRLVHVGDHWEFDYKVPRGVGITAFYLSRESDRSGPDVIRDLRRLPEVLNGGGYEDRSGE